MKKPILIVVSTYNRRDLTGITLDSVKKNKSSCSDVLIIDDASTGYSMAWLSHWGFEVLRSDANVGVGKAAFRRYREFLNRDYAYLCALDNDVQLARHFDVEMLKLFCAINDGNLSAVSGYRSTTQKLVLPDAWMNTENTDYLFVTTIGGISQFTDRETAVRILNAMEGKWEHPWDANISKLLTRIAVPKRSLIQHLGTHGTGVNGMSEDVAVDFVGEGQ